MTKARLVIPALPGIGDMLLAHGLLQILKKQEPAAPIDIIATAQSEPIAHLFPEIRDVLVVRREAGRIYLGDFLASVAKVRKRRYAASYAIQINPKFTFIPWLARIPKRIGFQRTKHGSFLLTQAFPSASPPKHVAYENATLANHNGNVFELPPPCLKFDADSVNELPNELSALAMAGNLIAICPGGVSRSH